MIVDTMTELTIALQSTIRDVVSCWNLSQVVGLQGHIHNMYCRKGAGLIVHPDVRTYTCMSNLAFKFAPVVRVIGSHYLW